MLLQVPIFSLLISGAMEAMRTMPIVLDDGATATWQSFRKDVTAFDSSCSKF